MAVLYPKICTLNLNKLGRGTKNSQSVTHIVYFSAHYRNFGAFFCFAKFMLKHESEQLKTRAQMELIRHLWTKKKVLNLKTKIVFFCCELLPRYPPKFWPSSRWVLSRTVKTRPKRRKRAPWGAASKMGSQGVSWCPPKRAFSVRRFCQPQVDTGWCHLSTLQATTQPQCTIPRGVTLVNPRATQMSILDIRHG